jgi:hypothetical protein
MYDGDPFCEYEDRMPEAGGANVEIAHHLNEVGQHHGQKTRWHELLEVVEAIVLAIVAICTAWSGYQAAKWDGLQDELYEKSTRLRVEAQGLATRGGQEQIYDASTVVEWIKAKSAGNDKLAQLFEHRLRPEFREAFDAWVKSDPLNNLDAPPGPLMMKEYRNQHSEEAAKRAEEASALFEHGAAARATSDKYVRVTVLLATVLLLVAISQRFKLPGVRLGLAIVAFVLLCFPLVRLVLLPRL